MYWQTFLFISPNIPNRLTRTLESSDGTLNIINPSRADVSSSLKIIDISSSLSPPGLGKRTFQAPLNNCPGDAVFFASYCVRSRTPQSYIILCYEASSRLAPPIQIRGNCLFKELCVGSVQTTEEWSGSYQDVIAYCVSAGKPVLVESPGGSSARSSGSSTIGFPPLTDVGDEVDIVMTDENDPTSSYSASHLQIAAQASIEIFGARSWRTLDGGVGACTTCASIRLPHVPKGTQRFDIQVSLPPKSSGWLFLLSVKR